MDPSTQNPVVQRRRLRLELRRLRQAGGWTQKDVAVAMDWSTSKLIRIESGDVRISLNDLRALLHHYGVTEPQRIETLVETARIARKETWTDFRDIYSPAFLKYISFETAASIIRGYDPLVIPGLLQTEAYARDVLAQPGQGRLGYATDDEVTATTVERRWLVRQLRQQIHDRPNPPKMSFVLDEAAIRRQVGGPMIMSEQLEQLRTWQSRDHVTLQVLPFEIGSYLGMGPPFMMLDFLTDDDVLLYLEDLDASSTEKDPEKTGFFIDVFLALEKRALSPNASDRLIARIIEEIKGA